MKTNTSISNPRARHTLAEAKKAARREARRGKYYTHRERVEGSPYFIIGYLSQVINRLESEK